MISITTKARDLKKSLSYLSSAVGTRTSAQQETSLLYVQVAEDNKLKLQVQGNVIVSATTLECTSAEADDMEFLIDFNTIDKYVKNNSINDDFIFNLDKLESEEIVTINVGSKFVGTLATVPLDAYEVQLFEDTTPISTIPTSIVNEMISMSCQFANMKQDTQDYMQIVAQDNELIFFTSDGEIISKFVAEQDIDEEFDITVRASALKKVNNFDSNNISVELTEDEYFVIFKEDESLRAILLHSDPPYNYHELDSVEEPHAFTLSVPSESILSALRSLECSSSDNLFNLHVEDDTLLKVYSEDLSNSKTEIDLDISIDNYTDIISGDTYKASIILFRKLGTIAKDNGKLNMSMWTTKDQNGVEFIDMVDATGDTGDVSYSISFGLMES